jgi:hypothetical protein
VTGAAFRARATPSADTRLSGIALGSANAASTSYDLVWVVLEFPNNDISMIMKDL